MNNVTLIGRLTKDPELRKTTEGKSICNFNIAIDDIFSKEERADFIRVTAFGTQAENCGKYLRKGLLTGVEGRFRSDQYTDAEGIRRYPINIVASSVQFLQWPDKEQSRDEANREDAR
jgi:single-strand DNA-binding protein